MDRTWKLTQEAFDKFLFWLNPDRDLAAYKYEAIRRSLLIFFNARGRPDFEEMADETINRVIRNVPASYEGDPTLYFIAVARYVYLESVRASKRNIPPEYHSPLGIGPGISERQLSCLEECLLRLPPNLRDMVSQYYSIGRSTPEGERNKLEHRKRLAEGMGVSLNALRIRMHRIRISLQECVTACIERSRGAE